MTSAVLPKVLSDPRQPMPRVLSPLLSPPLPPLASAPVQTDSLQRFKPFEPEAALNNGRLWGAQVLLKACLQLKSLATAADLLAYVCFALPKTQTPLGVGVDVGLGFTSQEQASVLLGALSQWRNSAVENLLKELLAQGFLAEAIAQQPEQQPEPEQLPRHIVLLPTAKGFALAMGFYVEPSTSQNETLQTETPPTESPQSQVAATTATPVALSKTEALTTKPPLRTPACFESAEEQALYDKLRAYRWQLAVEGKVRAYRICSNAVLHAMVQQKPKTLSELELLYGVGETFMSCYATGFLEHLENYLSTKLTTESA